MDSPMKCTMHCPSWCEGHNSVTPLGQDGDRSMVEEILLEALDEYITGGHENEKQLANLAKDLIQLTGHDPRVVTYLNLKAGKTLNGEAAWR